MVKKRKGFPEKPEKITSFGQRSKKGRPASDPRYPANRNSPGNPGGFPSLEFFPF